MASGTSSSSGPVADLAVEVVVAQVGVNDPRHGLLSGEQLAALQALALATDVPPPSSNES